jgi:hypothetical protein
MGCEIDVLLQPEGPVSPGDSVWVSVVVMADQEMSCRGVRCEAVWHAEGRTDDSGTAFDERAPGGTLRPGRDLGAQFQVRIPAEGPITWQGKLFALRWHIQVTLDVPWKDDPRAVAPLTVLPRES